MHPILTQGLPSALGAVQQSASSGEADSVTSTPNRSSLPRDKETNFDAIFSGLFVPSDKKPVKVAQIDPAFSQDVADAEVGKMDEVQASPISDELPDSEGFIMEKTAPPTASANLIAMSQAQPVQNGRLQNSEGEAPDPRVPKGTEDVPRQALETQAGILAKPAKYLQSESNLSSQGSVGKGIGLQEASLRPATSPSALLTSQTQAASHAFSTSALSPELSTASRSAIPQMLRANAPLAYIAPPNTSQNTTPGSTDVLPSVVQTTVAQKIPQAAYASPLLHSIVTGPTRTGFPVQLAATSVSLFDMMPRKPAVDRTAPSADPVLQILTPAKHPVPMTGLQVGAALSTIQSMPQSALDTSKLTPSSVEVEPLAAARGDISFATSIQHPQSLQATAHLPHYIARQVAEALQGMPNRPVEISLSPEELGRVRLALSTSEAGIVVNVLAERQETADLMRRHISNLEAAFHDIGYNDITFSFSSGAQTHEETEGDMARSGNARDGTDNDKQSAKAAQINLTAGIQSGLDIRL